MEAASFLTQLVCLPHVWVSFDCFHRALTELSPTENKSAKLVLYTSNSISSRKGQCLRPDARCVVLEPTNNADWLPASVSITYSLFPSPLSRSLSLSLRLCGLRGRPPVITSCSAGGEAYKTTGACSRGDQSRRNRLTLI